MAYCANCGAEMPDGIRFCGRCGTSSQQIAAAGPAASAGQSQPAQAAWPTSQTDRTAAAPQQPALNLRRLRPGDLIAGGGSLLLLITLFLPWYSAHQSPATRTPSPADVSHIESLALAICGGNSTCLNNAPSLSALHGGAGGWRILIAILAIITLVYLLVRAFLPTEPRLPVQHWQLVTALTAVTALLTLIALLANPLSALNGFGATASVGVGAIIGLIAALAAVAGGVLLRTGAPPAGQKPD
jgi:zinc-ribbon domain